MREVAVKVVAAKKIAAPKKIKNLEEKRLVPKMVLRRRLTRNAKMMLYLSDKCEFRGGKVVYASAFGELQATVNITDSILNETPVSPTSFQNSVYNSAPAYFSLIHADKDEILTLSSGMKSSEDALKTAALQALVSGERVLCVATECLDISNIETLNSCTDYLEAGAAVVLEACEDQEGAVSVEDLSDEGVIASLQELIRVVNMFHSGKDKILLCL